MHIISNVLLQTVRVLSFCLDFILRSGHSNNTGADLRSSGTPQYDVMDFATPPAENEANVYLSIPNDASSQRNGTSHSAIKRAEFANRLASMTDEDFRRQFKVSDGLLLLKRCQILLLLSK